MKKNKKNINTYKKNIGRGNKGTPIERFFKKVNKTDSCWEWTAYKNNDGYGVFYLYEKLILAHRASYLFFKGDIPNGLIVIHSCDNPTCVNPEHLTLTTQRENVSDMFSKGRNPKRFGEKSGVNKLTWKIVNEIRESNLSRFMLAKKFNVSVSTIGRIIKNKTWKSN